MSFIDEAMRSLTGAWRLFLGNPDGMRLFDTSFGGFWRSFLAILFVMPVYLPYVLTERQLLIDASGLDEALYPMDSFLVVRTMALVIDWIAFPILFAIVAKPLGLERRFVSFIVAHNWAGVIGAIPMAVPAILLGTGVLNEGVAAILVLIALAVVLRYYYMVVRIALLVPVGTAIGLVAADFLLSLVIGEFFGRMFSI